MFFIYLMAVEDEEERKTIEELYEKYKYHCLHMAIKYTNNQNDAEDIVQEAFVRIIKHRKKYLQLSCSDFERLLVVIIRNISIDFYRREKRVLMDVYDFMSEPKSGFLSPEDSVILNDDLNKVFKNLNEFDGETQSIICYRCMNVPVKVIADMMGIPKKNVEVKLYRARKRLKEELSENGLFD